MAEDGQTPLFDFMMVRAPASPGDAVLARHYIFNDFLMPDQPMKTNVPKKPGLADVSAVAGLVFKLVSAAPGDDPYADLLAELVRFMPAWTFDRQAAPDAQQLTLEVLEHNRFLRRDVRYHLIPEQLTDVAADLVPALVRALDALDAGRTRFDRGRLVARLEKIFNGALVAVVFDQGGHQQAYRQARWALFDALYLLFVLRRWVPVNLERILAGLRGLHAIEALAVDQLYARVLAGKAAPAEVFLLGRIAPRYPGLRDWDGRSPAAGFPLVADGADLAELLAATPVIHPIFARLHRYLRPFNDIKPIGVGDLKVVRQTLTAYRPGEISHIHNVLKGETRLRDHRKLEKVEDVFSFTGTESAERTSESQSTERFEVKQEAEGVVRTTLGVTANANLSYSNDAAHITASAGAGFAYNRNTEDHTKLAQSFARDVVAKAVSRIESRATTTRSVTRLTETEETNSQNFNNVKGDGHISGMYRWIDKEYTAQLYNYGKRLMFEFQVPEPAAFWIAARLESHTVELDVPQLPAKPKPDRPELGFTWQQVDEPLLVKLRGRYEGLRDVTFPARTRVVVLRDVDSRERQFAEQGIDKPNYSHSYNCQVDRAAGYEITEVVRTGYAEFYHRASEANPNRLGIYLNDRLIHSDAGYPYTYDLNGNGPPAEPIVFSEDDLPLRFDFSGPQHINLYRLQLTLHLGLTAEALQRFQLMVHGVVLAAEEKRLEAANQEREAAYRSAVEEYHGRLAELEHLLVRDVIRGGAEAANRAVMDEEVKKHCLTMLTKEFDTVPGDDRLADRDAMGRVEVRTRPTRFEITGIDTDRTAAGFVPADRQVWYPAADLEAARDKGPAVQFLEQSFEWSRMSYLFYPYFWAARPRWLELMSRSDEADPNFTAFLRSGMARVLLAVTPGYEGAVLHYLATGDVWNGGPSPVIGDPLFVPLHAEIREQTDDRLGGTAEGEPWTYVVPTSLVYLHGSQDQLPDLVAERAARAGSAAAPG
ncbi:hypothetical protein [Dactylosporangium sp. CS-033363]|uniref:hypothetical protein n=1 Tax=Dactylosporangium sp. CS-033363 TaxID=3239935 RepID=UPI003D89BEEC